MPSKDDPKGRILFLECSALSPRDEGRKEGATEMKKPDGFLRRLLALLIGPQRWCFFTLARVR
jgi:hypothetical protein